MEDLFRFISKYVDNDPKIHYINQVPLLAGTDLGCGAEKKIKKAHIEVDKHRIMRYISCLGSNFHIGKYAL